MAEEPIYLYFNVHFPGESGIVKSFPAVFFSLLFWGINDMGFIRSDDFPGTPSTV